MNLEKKIIVVAGDPNSINSEIIYKSWKKLNKNLRKKILLIANFELIKKQFKELNYPIKIEKIKKINELSNTKKLNIINIDLKFNNPFKVKRKNSSKYIYESLNLAHKLSLKGNILGMINCPINKNLLQKENTGVTEFLSKKCKLKDKSEVMMIKTNNFAVCPITTHLELRNVSKKIKSKMIITKVKTVNKSLKNFYKKNPKIGILGLNPHNAELKDNSEEVKQIIPAIKKLKKLGLKVEGPLVTDTIFIKNFKNYDVIIGMYHDQVLSPFKSIYKFNAINLTLGLKYLRASPYHGVAKDLIKKNKANGLSLLECIKFINKFGK